MIFVSEIVNCSYLNLSTISSESIWSCTINYIGFKLITNKMVMTKLIKLCSYYELLVGTGNNSHGTSFGLSISGTLGTYDIHLFIVFVSTCQFHVISMTCRLMACQFSIMHDMSCCCCCYCDCCCWDCCGCCHFTAARASISSTIFNCRMELLLKQNDWLLPERTHHLVRRCST